MKIIFKIVRILIIVVLFILASCHENEFLEEKPLAVYVADNTLVTTSDFQAAVNMLYQGPEKCYLLL